jgi:hypothetical protein
VGTSPRRCGLNEQDANMCDAVVDLFKVVVDGDIEFRTAFDPAWDFPGGVSAPTRARLRSRDHAIVEYAAETLRGPSVAVGPVATRAWVTQLKYEGQHGTSKTRRVTLLWNQDRNLIRAQAVLDDAEYATAVLAHKDDLPVWVEGFLSRSGRRYDFDRVSRFVIDQSV